jgi:hypothetical protein
VALVLLANFRFPARISGTFHTEILTQHRELAINSIEFAVFVQGHRMISEEQNA